MNVAAAVPTSTMPRPGRSTNRLASCAEKIRTIPSRTMLATMPIRVDGLTRTVIAENRSWNDDASYRGGVLATARTTGVFGSDLPVSNSHNVYYVKLLKEALM